MGATRVSYARRMSERSASAFWCWLHHHQPTAPPTSTTPSAIHFQGRRGRYSGRSPDACGRAGRNRGSLARSVSSGPGSSGPLLASSSLTASRRSAVAAAAALSAPVHGEADVRVAGLRRREHHLLHHAEVDVLVRLQDDRSGERLLRVEDAPVALERLQVL